VLTADMLFFTTIAMINSSLVYMLLFSGIPARSKI